MKLVAFLVVLLLPVCAFAQMDPGTLTLVNPPASGASAASAASSGSDMRIPADAVSGSMGAHHYVKKHKSAAAKKARRPASATEDAPPSDAGTVSDLQNGQVAPLPRLGGGNVDNFNNQSTPEPTSSSQEENPTFGNRMRDIFLGGDPEVIDKYRSFLDTEDIRKNVFELTLASTYVYNTSMSPYFYRNYIDSAPGAVVGLDLWVTPFLGVDADYRSTMLGSIKDSPTQDVYISANQTWFDIGFKFRRFFGMAVNSSSLTVGLRYADFTLSAPPGSLSRSKEYTQGPELTLEAMIPSSKSYSWKFGLDFEPYLSHSEISGSTDVRSGQSNQTAGYGASIGGEYRMSRHTRVFFDLSTRLYRSQFSGSASAVDPVTGVVPSNVPVTNAFYMFDLGVKLGK